MAWNDHLLLKIVNIAAFVIFTSSNAYGNLAPGNTVGSTRETYITPAPWIFVIWPIIHVLLLGSLVYQFFAGFGPIIEGIGWRFPILAILTSIYAGFAAGSHHTTINAILAFVTILIIAGVVSHIYRDLKINHPSRNILDVAFIHLPFSLYHGLVVVLIFVAGFNAFGLEKHACTTSELVNFVAEGIITATKHNGGDHAPIDVHPEPHHSHCGPGIATNVLVFLSLLFLEATTVGYAMHGQGDVAGALVISLSLLAIFQQQSSPYERFIHWSALVLFILSLVATARALISAFQNRGRIALRDEERAPLVA